MPRTYTSLTLEDAKQMLAAAEAKAASLGILDPDGLRVYKGVRTEV